MKTHPSLTKFNARFTITVFDKPNLLRTDVRDAYGCCTLSSKFRVVSINCSASNTLSRYCSNQSCETTQIKLTYKIKITTAI